MARPPTVARYLLAGRPRPRIADAVKIGEVMRTAAMSKFGWEPDQDTGKRIPLAPWRISGRDALGRPVRDPAHPHAFWLPEDADDDGWIDHVTVFVAGGMDADIQSRLDRITRIWITGKGTRRGNGHTPRIDEWRLALEGFGRPEDFAGSSRLLETEVLPRGGLKSGRNLLWGMNLTRGGGLDSVYPCKKHVISLTSHWSWVFWRRVGRPPSWAAGWTLSSARWSRSPTRSSVNGSPCSFGPC